MKSRVTTSITVSSTLSVTVLTLPLAEATLRAKSHIFALDYLQPHFIFFSLPDLRPADLLPEMDLHAHT